MPAFIPNACFNLFQTGNFHFGALQIRNNLVECLC